jgi:uncharacterized protein (UPF0264 family)
MMQLLISVTSIEEAQIALENGADFIDLKDPAQGALGALPLITITEIVRYVKAGSNSRNKFTSATIGDLPMKPQLIAEQVVQLAKTGVDIIKIGFFDDNGNNFSGYESCLSSLAPLAKSGLKLIAVLFAEHKYPFSLISSIKNAGFYGVMLDTAVKNGATFLDYFTEDEFRKFSENIRTHNLIFGLAGSLGIQHVAKVKEFNPSYMGFRGGVCVDNQRKLRLDSVKISTLHKSLQSML